MRGQRAIARRSTYLGRYGCGGFNAGTSAPALLAKAVACHMLLTAVLLRNQATSSEGAAFKGFRTSAGVHIVELIAGDRDG